MINLWEETVEELSDNGKSWEDVKYVLLDDETEIEKDYYPILANRIYDNGFGGVNVSLGLQIVGDDWWLERQEYDGSENFVFKKLPKRQKNIGVYSPFPNEN